MPAAIFVVLVLFRLILEVTFVTQTPLLGIECGCNIPAVVAGQLISGNCTGIGILRVRFDQQFGFEIPASGVRKGRYMGPVARQAHNV